ARPDEPSRRDYILGGPVGTDPPLTPGVPARENCVVPVPRRGLLIQHRSPSVREWRLRHTAFRCSFKWPFAARGLQRDGPHRTALSAGNYLPSTTAWARSIGLRTTGHEASCHCQSL